MGLGGTRGPAGRSRIQPQRCCWGSRGLGNTQGGEEEEEKEEEGRKAAGARAGGPGAKRPDLPAPRIPDLPHVGRPAGLGGSLCDNLSGVPPAPGDDRNPRGGRAGRRLPPAPRSTAATPQPAPLTPRGTAEAHAGTPKTKPLHRVQGAEEPREPRAHRGGHPPVAAGATLTWKWPRTYLAMG